MVSKKDFKAVAEIIADDSDYNYVQLYKEKLCYHLADYFATQNPRFDRSRFMKACGLTE